MDWDTAVTAVSFNAYSSSFFTIFEFDEPDSLSFIVKSSNPMILSLWHTV